MLTFRTRSVEGVEARRRRLDCSSKGCGSLASIWSTAAGEVKCDIAGRSTRTRYISRQWASPHRTEISASPIALPFRGLCTFLALDVK